MKKATKSTKPVKVPPKTKGVSKKTAIGGKNMTQKKNIEDTEV
jgi:hypothetical protein